MKTLQDLEKEIDLIKRRNNRVETDKAWETSLTRRTLLIIFTYLAIGLYLNMIGMINPWLNSIVPSAGFLLSTLTLPFFKSFWEKYIKK